MKYLHKTIRYKASRIYLGYVVLLLSIYFSPIGSLCVSGQQTQVVYSQDYLAQCNEYIEGLKFYYLEEYEKAIQQFRKAAIINNKSSAVQYQLALCFIKKKEYTIALDKIQQAIQMDKKKDHYRYYQTYANIYITLGDPNAAIKVYEKLLKKTNQKLKVYQVLVKWAEETQQYTRAINYYNFIEKEKGISPDITYKKVALLDKIGKPDKGNAVMRKFLVLYPNNYDALLTQATRLLAQKKHKEATIILKKAAKIDPQSPQFLKLFSKLQQQQPITAGQTGANLSPEEKFLQAEALIEKNALEEAKKILLDLLQTQADSKKINLKLGEIYYIQKDYTAALPYYLKGLEDDYAMLDKWKIVCQIHLMNHDGDALVDVALHVLDYYPNQAEMYYYLGKGYEQKGEKEEAIKSWERGERLGGNSPKNNMIRTSLLTLYLEKKEYTKYFDTQAKLIHANDDAISNKLLFCQLSLRVNKRRKEALTYAETLVQEQPNKTTYLKLFARLLLAEKQGEKAKIYIEKANSVSKKEDTELLELEGDLQQLLGNSKKAFYYWSQAQKIKPSAVLKEKMNKAEKNH